MDGFEYVGFVVVIIVVEDVDVGGGGEGYWV